MGRWPPPVVLSNYGSSRGRGDEMAQSIFTVLPQGDVAYSISVVLLELLSLLLFCLKLRRAVTICRPLEED